MTVNDASDPIWTGITVSNGNPTPEAIHTSNTHTIDPPVPTGAVVVASSPVNDKPLIVRYPAGETAPRSHPHRRRDDHANRRSFHRSSPVLCRARI